MDQIKYNINPHNPERTKQFEEEAARIWELWIHFLQVEHIGSTSVPWMKWKQTIDMMYVVKSLEGIEKVIAAFESIWYIFIGKVHDDSSYILKNIVDWEHLFIIQLFPENHHGIREALALKSYLSTHTDEVIAYSDCKDYLFSQFANDYSMYRKQKDEYMKLLKERAFRRAKSLEYSP